MTRPEIEAVLADEGIEGDAIPDSQFLHDGIKWLDASTIDSALGGVSGATGGTANDGLVHGLGLLSASIDGTELTDGVPGDDRCRRHARARRRGPEPGGGRETGVTVTVTVDGGDTRRAGDRQHRPG